MFQEIQDKIRSPVGGQRHAAHKLQVLDLSFFLLDDERDDPCWNE